MSAAQFTDLPPETQLHIFGEVDPTDLGTLPQVSKLFNRLISGNELLFKGHYLRQWDDPTKHPAKPAVSWRRDFQERIAALNVAGYSNEDAQRDRLGKLAAAVSSIAASARTDVPESDQHNIPLLTDLFNKDKRPENIDRLLSQSALFGRAKGHCTDADSMTHQRRQQIASAKMHCLYGSPILHNSQGVNMYPYAASKVYDLRNYKTENHWGPFLDDGSGEVDWEKLEAIMLVLGYNIQRIDHDGESSVAKLWRRPFYGTAAYSYRPPNTELSDGGDVGEAGFPAIKAPWCKTQPGPELEAQDPYGITGTWLRIVCFLDYRDLYEYNFGRSAHLIGRTEPRAPLGTDEAVRLLVMTLVVTGIHYPEVEDDSMQADVPPEPVPDGRPDYRKMPIVSFTGTARALHPIWDPNANSAIRGTVMTTPEGEVRWTSVSVYHGVEERWKSEGIQVGGMQSARGVLGSWFDKDYRPEGPAGPTAFWKIRDTVNCKPEDRHAVVPGLWIQHAGNAIWLEGND